MLASAVGVATFLAQLPVADFARVKVHGTSSAPDLETVMQEEALVKGNEPLDPEQFDDHVRLLMRAHSWTSEWDAEVLMDSMVNIIEVKRSSPDKRTLTCEQATNFLFLQTKWRIDDELAAALERGDAKPASAVAPLVACAGDSSSDSTCTALTTLAAKCPQHSFDDLLAMRIEMFGGYADSSVAGSDVDSESEHGVELEADAASVVPDNVVEDVEVSEASHGGSAKADEESVVEEVEGADDDEKAENEDTVEAEEETVAEEAAPAEETSAVEEPEAVAEQQAPVREQEPATPNYYEPCKVNYKVHELHKDKANKCNHAIKAGTCPEAANMYCYASNLAGRCCCGENDLQIKNKIGGQRVKKGTAKCANVYPSP
eukprot:TRINITY_DN1248_c0_g1_i3.p1 TRINITY_DN1248_c0_g1~~TRINITY_DN1248_c0_g1_i3.p1  ORF type:complete len:374 (+),score=103.57 TRINITY_DN1248_c0_g1_i3:63-1184(+)